MHSIITLYIDILRPQSDSEYLFLNIYGRPLGQGEASKYLTKYFRQFGLQLTSTTVRKVLVYTYAQAFHDGVISKTGERAINCFGFGG